jgi:hypothetical protein
MPKIEKIEDYYQKELKVKILDQTIHNTRIFAKAYSLYEMLFVINVLLENNFYDSYLIKEFFNKFGKEEILLNMLDNCEKYSIIYFKDATSVRMVLLKILEKYIDFTYAKQNCKREDLKMFSYEKANFMPVLEKILSRVNNIIC